ncbi:MAG TPA: hypothetical protein VLG69_00330, partial [Candidatus Andersenbacteria bacterium]|nr:hypothetical protein [Candidatus Andersenbacteria bacterium]
MKYTHTIYIIAVACIVLGWFLFGVKSDVRFADLKPTEESKYLVPMQSGVRYDEDIIVHNKIISRIGIYLLPLHPLLQHQGIIHLSLMRGNTILESGEINSSYIDSTVPSEIIFAHPVASATDETLRIRVTVSDSISTDIALRNRVPDNDFAGEGVVFSVNGEHQQYPFAYTASEVLHPSLMKQVGGLFIAIGLGILVWPFIKRRSLIQDHLILITISVLQSFSAIGSTTNAGIYGLLVFGVLLVSWWILRIAGRSRLASVFGACVSACSSWIPLALLSSHVTKTQLSFKDALLDPNQIVVSHAAGAYIGFFALFFAVLGLCILSYKCTRDTRRAVRSDLAMFVALIISSILAFTHLFSIPSATVVVAFCFAWFASLGFDGMQRFIGIRDRLAFVL